METKYNRPKAVSSTPMWGIVFFTLREFFKLNNEKNKDLNPKDYPGKGYIEPIEF